MTEIAIHHLRRGEKVPFDRAFEAGDASFDWAEYAVRGVLSDLRGRQGIGHDLVCMDDRTKTQLVRSLADIVRQAHLERGGMQVEID